MARTRTREHELKIGILGSGTMGCALSARLIRGGHDVRVGARLPTGSQVSYAAAVAHGDVVFLALPWPHGVELVRRLGPFEDRILVDVSNPETKDGRGLLLGHDNSGAECIAASADGAHVVKAFSHFYAELLHDDVAFDGGAASVLYCGDDAKAKDTVRRIIASCGLDPIDAGGLGNARYLEPMAMLTVQLVRAQGWGPTGVAWRLMRRIEHRSQVPANEAV